MKTYKLILLVLSMLGLLISTSCSSDDNQVLSTPTPTIPTVLDVPAWLEGEWSSQQYLEEDVSYISAEEMHLNFAPFSQDVYYFSMDDIDVSSASVDEYTVHYYNGINITFYDLSNTTNIVIIMNDNGVLYDFGTFVKQ